MNHAENSMATISNHSLPSFLAIRDAIMAAPPRPEGFPLAALGDPGRLEAVRQAAHFQQFLAELRSEAAQARSTPIPPLPFSLFHLFETTGDRGEYERPYFDRRRRLLALALETAVDQTDANLPALHDLIWELCNEYTWAMPAHLPVGIATVQAHRLPPEQIIDLFAAHTAHALAETLALLGERLDSWLHYRVRTEIERRVFQPLFHDPRHFKWEVEPINWAAVCGGCAGMAALILEDDRERLAGMIDRVMRALACFLEGFGADGGCLEGIGYWEYGFGHYTYFAEMLYSFTDGRLDLFQGDKVQRIVAFPQAISLGDDAFVNYSDAAEHVTIHSGLGSYLKARFQQPIPALGHPSFHTDPIYRWGNVTRDLLWTDVALGQTAVTDGSVYLPDIAWVVDRRIVNGKTIAFSAKGGHNDEPHNHNDLGHFILHLGGESLLADLGAGVYTRQYFGAERYEALHTGSQGHSAPVINGVGQGNGRSYTATVLNHQSQPDGVVFALDLTHAYPETAELDSFTRSFAWTVDVASGSAGLRLVDAFRFRGETAVVEECFISLKPPTLARGTAVWRGEHGIVTLQFDSRQCEPIFDTIATQTHIGEMITVFRLRLRIQTSEANHQEAVLTFACQLQDEL
jgi:hypothetical protein